MPASTLSRRSVALLRVNLGATKLRKADQFHTETAQENKKTGMITERAKNPLYSSENPNGYDIKMVAGGRMTGGKFNGLFH